MISVGVLQRFLQKFVQRFLQEFLDLFPQSFFQGYFQDFLLKFVKKFRPLSSIAKWTPNLLKLLEHWVRYLTKGQCSNIWLYSIFFYFPKKMPRNIYRNSFGNFSILINFYRILGAPPYILPELFQKYVSEYWELILSILH